MDFVYGKRTIPMEIRFEDRKTFRVDVPAPDHVLVHAPAGSPDDAIQKAAEDRADWIAEQLAAKRAPRPAASRKYVNGETYLHLGRSFRLDIREDPGRRMPKVRLSGFDLMVVTPKPDPEAVREALDHWYRRQTRLVVLDRIEYFAPRVGAQPAAVRIRGGVGRWAVRSGQGELAFDERLITAPSHVVDCIVAHALCQLVESPRNGRFWARLGAVLPDYRVRMAWLLDHADRLDG